MKNEIIERQLGQFAKADKAYSVGVKKTLDWQYADSMRRLKGRIEYPAFFYRIDFP